ncbi:MULTISPECIES: hypothetical protein [unclassified Gordonia (in: high G+C Gram-positive bacteria)]|uniref:hypothetical protein n=4 Tax=Gordonia TaxID=2053 RepID=UPI000B1BBA23|nr:MULTISPECIES: hypothetical protein [unclassified Gordonia (in: high G+C Gram-positive bacteria)]MBN0984024.1 hypothetical protein [Gordonia sp. BP-94]WGJ84203.1 hypothetical protein QAD21_15560 [Gordonia sp. SMJS1]
MTRRHREPQPTALLADWDPFPRDVLPGPHPLPPEHPLVGLLDQALTRDGWSEQIQQAMSDPALLQWTVILRTAANRAKIAWRTGATPDDPRFAAWRTQTLQALADVSTPDQRHPNGALAKYLRYRLTTTPARPATGQRAISASIRAEAMLAATSGDPRTAANITRLLIRSD